ncbi:MAG: PA0069 family radical SAM protein [Rhodospirillales bacterium]|nr:PA0069 family radical SAM protein [Rhodospirillales bacterium]
MIDILPDTPKKGRGAHANRTGRFEPRQRIAIDDGWVMGEDDLPPLRTTVSNEVCRTAITYNKSPDLPFDRSINPYRGCEHGCAYCYARPSHATMGLSPGLDFESKLFAKSNIAEALERDLRKPGYRAQGIMLGANTDPYQPIERAHRLTRQVLEVLAAYQHPVAIVTKSNLVLRDLDILGPMAEKGLASVAVSVTTLDRHLSRKLEPRAPTPDKRLQAIRDLSAAGIPVSVFASPMIPFLNDAELEAILEAGVEAGATSASYILVRLSLELKELFADWLELHAPGKKDHVLSLIRQNRGGDLNDTTFGARMTGNGPLAQLLSKRFHLACRHLSVRPASGSGLNLDCTDFKTPPRPGDQMALF